MNSSERYFKPAWIEPAADNCPAIRAALASECRRDSFRRRDKHFPIDHALFPTHTQICDAYSTSDETIDPSHHQPPASPWPQDPCTSSLRPRLPSSPDRGRSQSRNSERFASVSTNSTVLVPSYLACRSETRSSVDGRTLTRTSSLLRQRPSMPSRQTDEAPCMALLSASRMSFTRKTCPPSTFPLSTRETTHGWTPASF